MEGFATLLDSVFVGRPDDEHPPADALRLLKVRSQPTSQPTSPTSNTVLVTADLVVVDESSMANTRCPSGGWSRSAGISVGVNDPLTFPLA